MINILKSFPSFRVTVTGEQILRNLPVFIAVFVGLPAPMAEDPMVLFFLSGTTVAAWVFWHRTTKGTIPFGKAERTERQVAIIAASAIWIAVSAILLLMGVLSFTSKLGTALFLGPVITYVSCIIGGLAAETIADVSLRRRQG